MEFDEWEDEYEDWEDDPVQLALESGDLPCAYGYCGPECEYWMGDGLCELTIKAQAEAEKEYREKHFHKDVECQVCGKKLNMYDVDAKEPFTVPADQWWLGLEVYRAIWVEKSILHEYRDQEGYKVIHLKLNVEKDNEHLVRLLKDKA